MSKKLLLKTDIKREGGKLYFVKTMENGCLAVYETTMTRGRKRK